LIVAPILLSLFGIMMIYSASMVSTTIDGLEDTYYLFKQLSWFVLCLIGFLFCFIFPYRYYHIFIFIIIFVSLFLLVCVIFFCYFVLFFLIFIIRDLLYLLLL